MKTNKKILGVGIILFTGLCAFSIVFVIAIIMIIIVLGSKDTISVGFLLNSPTHGMTSGGIFPAIIGTFLLVIIMSIAGIPFGTITAIYLSEYTKKESFFAKIIRFAVNTLAGIPSIVFGLFGLGFFIQFIGRNIDRAIYSNYQVVWGQPCLLWASLTMAILTLPVVIVSVEEAIKAVPKELREASLALGATKFQTLIKVVLPNSLSGILTGSILAVSRGAGEVAPILFTGAAYFLPHLPSKLSDQFMELGYHIYIMSTQSTNVEETIGIQYATTLVLLALTFLLNFTAIIIRHKIRQRTLALQN
jgi:phosphate transport system permease protein